MSLSRAATIARLPGSCGLAALSLGIWLVIAARVPAGTLVHTDGGGRVVALALDGAWFEVGTNVVAALPNWSRAPGLDPESVRDVRFAQDGKTRTWTGRILVADGATCAFTQTITESAASARFDITVTADNDLNLDGVFLFVKVPVALFAGTPCILESEGVSLTGTVAPQTLAKECRFLQAKGSRALIGSPETVRLAVGFEAARELTIQDEREWKGSTYSLFTRLSSGLLAKGQAAAIRFTLALDGKVSHSPVHLVLKPEEKLYTLEGFGGNFVYGIESPVTRYMLNNLRTSWARVQMSLSEWAPQSGSAAPGAADRAAVAAQDKPGSHLRQELELAQELQKRGIPWCVSVWELPEWLYADPGKGPGVDQRRVAPDKWPELLEAIGSYLLYAKRQYGAEPDLFSFNEPDGGVRVLLSPEEHRDAIKLLGAHFQKIGLKTKLLLGDMATPRGSELYLLPAIKDPDAMRYVGALSFHAWGGATAAEYGAWARLAQDTKLPLLVAETGVDAGAWRLPSQIQTFHYAIEELRRYQELLLQARPQALLQWEFTSDYGCVEVQKAPTGLDRFWPTWRFSFLQQFCNLTPRQATALAMSSDQESVLVTAFTGRQERQQIYSFHIANLGTSRLATIAGLPPGVERLRAVRTDEEDMGRELAPVEVDHGRFQVRLTPHSLLTLTTMPAP